MVSRDFLLHLFSNVNQRCYRSTTKDDDNDNAKDIDQPEKMKRDESSISLEPRNDTPGVLNNNTLEGAIGNFINEGISSGTVDANATRFDEVTTRSTRLVGRYSDVPPPITLRLT